MEENTVLNTVTAEQAHTFNELTEPFSSVIYNTQTLIDDSVTLTQDEVFNDIESQQYYYPVVEPSIVSHDPVNAIAGNSKISEHGAKTSNFETQEKKQESDEPISSKDASLEEPSNSSVSISEKAPILNTNEEMKILRRVLYCMSKEKNVTFLKFRKKMLKIYKKLDKLTGLDKSTEYTDKNMLSMLFIKISQKIFECITIDNDKIHVFFKLLINCYLINFEKFIKSKDWQIDLLFTYIFDLIYINAGYIKKSQNSEPPSYMKYLIEHKVKNQITIMNNHQNYQILLYYFIQLLFLIITKQDFLKKYRCKIFPKLYKLMAFLIYNGNKELVRIYRRNVKQVEIKAGKKSI